MSTMVEAIYEHGIFKPVSGVPATLKEHDRVQVIIETDTDDELKAEFEQWDAASSEDFHSFEKSLGELG